MWSSLSFLSEPWFVIPWYLVGVVGAALVAIDVARNNTPLKTAIKWGWPIIVLFFSVVGLALYFATARAPGIAHKTSDEKTEAHAAYERNMWRRVNGAVIHCVAGDGLGIMTAMVIARVFGFTFWQEFWFEYAVGFAFGWFIFQFKSMTMMTDSLPKALLMAFRAEFFSMLTVMGGMGAVMAFVTPAVVGAQPKPLTYAFWGFGMFGLLVGYVFTFPMNWLMIKLGWKHGMGSPQDSRPAEQPSVRAGILTTMGLLGAAALALPAWLTALRQATQGADVGLKAEKGPPTNSLPAGLMQSVKVAMDGLRSGHRKDATNALDAAFRSSQVLVSAAPSAESRAVTQRVTDARRALQMGDPGKSIGDLEHAATALNNVGAIAATAPARLDRYLGVPVLDTEGHLVGEVRSVDRDRVLLALGGAQDIWGFLDWGGASTSVPVTGLVFGPRRALGKSYVILRVTTAASRQ